MPEHPDRVGHIDRSQFHERQSAMFHLVFNGHISVDTRATKRQQREAIRRLKRCNRDRHTEKHEKPYSSKVCETNPSWLKTAQKWLKTAQNGPKIAQNGSKMVQNHTCQRNCQHILNPIPSVRLLLANGHVRTRCSQIFILKTLFLTQFVKPSPFS